MRHSDLRDLWSESGSLKRWANGLEGLLEVLQEALTKPLPERKPKAPGIPRMLQKHIEAVSPDDHGKLRAKLWQRLQTLENINQAQRRVLIGPPLVELAKQGLLPEVELLIDRGADPNVRDVVDLTPLAYAASRGHVAVVDLLLRRGARLFKEYWQQVEGMPREYAIGAFGAAAAGSVETLRVLVKYGADMKQLDMNSDTLLHKAANGARRMTPGLATAVIDYLIDCGIDVNSRDNLKETPLHAAVRSDNLEAVSCLLQHGADPNVVGDILGTPLNYFCLENGDPPPSTRGAALEVYNRPWNDITRLLLKHGAIRIESPPMA